MLKECLTLSTLLKDHHILILLSSVKFTWKYSVVCKTLELEKFFVQIVST